MDMQEFLKLLVCPACHEALEHLDGGLLCSHCKVIYPIRDNIPVLLIEAAIPSEQWDKEKKP